MCDIVRCVQWITDCGLAMLCILRVLNLNYVLQSLIWCPDDCCFTFGYLC